MLVLWPLQGKFCSVQFPPPTAENEQTRSSFLHRNHTDIPRKGKKADSYMTKGDKSTNIHCKMCFQRKRLPWYVAMEIIESSVRAVDLIGWSLTPEFHCTPSSSTYVEGNHPIWMKNGNNVHFYCLYCNIWSLISEHLLALLPCRWPLLSTSLGLHRSCCRSWRCPPLAETALSCLEQQSCIVPQLYWLPWVWILYKANNNLWLAHVNWWFIDTLWVRD